MNNELPIFQFHRNFNDDELEQDFYDFFAKYNLMPLFSNEHRAPQIYTDYLDMKSVVKPGGSFHKTLLDMAEILTIGDDNKMYEEALFRIIYNASTFKQMIKSIRKIINYYMSEVDKKHEFNLWNIVWYKKDLS